MEADGFDSPLPPPADDPDDLDDPDDESDPDEDSEDFDESPLAPSSLPAPRRCLP